METVRLLDSYRMAIARDADAVRILAFLHRDGPQTDTALAETVRLPLHEMRRKLTELFRASFVTLVEQQRYATSEMAEQVLAHLGVPDVAAKETVFRSLLPESDKTALVSFLTDRDTEPAEWRRYLAAAVKSTAQLQRFANLDEESILRVWYGVVAGLDPATHELGPELSCKAAFSKAKLVSRSAAIDMKRFEHRCYVALDDRAASNNFIATGKRSESIAESQITLAITFIRLLASLLSKYTDEGIAAAATTTGFNPDALNVLGMWSQPFAHECMVGINYGPRGDARRSGTDFVTAVLADLPGVSVKWNKIADTNPASGSVPSSVTSLLLAVEKRVSEGKVDPTDRVASLTLIDRIRRKLAPVTHDIPRA